MDLESFLGRADLPPDLRKAIETALKDRGLAEQARKDQSGMFESILGSMSDGVVVCDPSGKFVFFNSAAKRILGVGLSESTPDKWGHEYGVFTADMKTPFAVEEFPILRALRGEVSDDVDQFIRNPQIPEGVFISVSSRPWKDEGGSLKGAVAVFRDVTELRRVQEDLRALNETLEERVRRGAEELRKTEDQLRQVQKFEAIGRLAGGVAHDFNNLLTAIMGYGQLALLKLKPEEPLHADIQEIIRAGERAADLTRQLLAFSRKQVLQPKVLGLNDLVKGIERMLRRLIGEDLDLVASLEPSLGNVRVDPGQVEQVLLNLAVNARDAMPEGGRLTIETRNADLDESYARQHLPVRPGSYVMLAVSDTGIGMSEEIKAHLFEPFFTTKELGKGTGLGLSTVYGIVKQSGGNIWVYSEPGQGTTFKIYFPRVEEPAQSLVGKAAPPLRTEGTETLLLVEDSDAVRKLAREVLRARGYSILEARTGKEAIEVASAHKGPFDLLLTDIVMPEMSGRALATYLSAARPGLKVVYISGYSEDAVVHHGVLDRGTPFLSKPFTPYDLARKVREVLDGPEARP